MQIDNMQGVKRIGLSVIEIQVHTEIRIRLGVSRTIYVNVDSPNLGFPYFNFLGGLPVKKKTPCIL